MYRAYICPETKIMEPRGGIQIRDRGERDEFCPAEERGAI